MVELKFYKVSGLDFKNTVANGTQLKLKNQVKYNVNYYDAEKRCVGKLEFRVEDETMQPFEIKVEMEAVFTYDDGDDQALVHTESFAQLFPFLRQVIHTTTSMSGMPGLMIPIMKLNPENVNINKANNDETVN